VSELLFQESSSKNDEKSWTKEPWHSNSGLSSVAMEEETKQLLQEYQQHVVYKEIVLEIYLPPRCRQEGWSLRRLLKEHTDAINNPNHANWTLIDEEMQKLEEYFRRNPEMYV